MALLVLSLTILSLAMTSAMDIPAGYILDVKPVCGSSVRARPIVKILTDLNIRAVARCANGDLNFTKYDAANYELVGSYVHSSRGCLFTNHKGTYKLDVAIIYGLPGSGLLSNEQVYTVSCSFNSKAKISASRHQVVGGLVSPHEKLYNVGTSVSSSYITLNVQDIRRNTISTSIPIDKVITLYAVSLGTLKEIGLRAVSCYGIGATNKKRYAILRAGCGDGQVIPHNTGFITNGRTTRSPYFKSFYVEGDKLVSYECTFQLCTGSCNGSSCSVGKNLVKGIGISCLHIPEAIARESLWPLLDWPLILEEKCTSTDNTARIGRGSARGVGQIVPNLDWIVD
ncbi:vitelline envelope sperm lysin receptor isoform X2 [Patella vulgata]|uniref:vitelline envelope sperm lysin receptor isoform X2 n=1 Tax=Patella vulgata TaxID=6465 RepID=UPI0024A84C35|nr:vitelline envelope sperm lysin receptor isoform X2 [Patella vulgata]